MKMTEMFWYSWLCLFWTIVSVACPPLALGFLALPAIHRRRRRKQAEWREMAAHRAKIRWIENL